MGLDCRGSKHVEVVLSERNAHRRRDGRHCLAEFETIAIAAEKGNGLRAEVHNGDGVVLCRDSARVAADTALAQCGHGLNENTIGVVYEEFVTGSIRARDHERSLMVSRC